MVDGYGREINYLRISVTDRCNLRCQYCMPAEGIQTLTHDQILTLEEIQRVVKVAATVGIKKVRLTGGEPLVRKNLLRFIEYMKDIDEIDDVSITTNGILFPDMAEELKNAGLNRVNISMDTMVPERYSFITRGGKLEIVQLAVQKALALGMKPVKLNVVVIKGFNDVELMDFAQLAYDYPLHVRFIEFMPIGDLLFWDRKKMFSAAQMREIIEKEFTLEEGKRIRGNGPACYYGIKGGIGSLGFINPISSHFCAECNRIRLTADGKLRPCLYDHHEVDLKKALRDGTSDEGIRDLVVQAIQQKPERHHMDRGWGENNSRKMSQIGG
ncbi:MAG: GTP 3',8-cyclase MoaA [Bacillota bacterium]|nr:GTP 3',8-cyclase MoaA [Bacillota bacterium]